MAGSNTLPFELDRDLSKARIVQLLDTNDPLIEKALFERAYQVKAEHVGTQVYFRGIVEFSNQCVKDCYYCGIRRSNTQVRRFTMSEEDIVAAGLWIHDNGYGSMVLQSGERRDAGFVDFVERVVRKLKEKTQGELGITLSLGEQTADTYRCWLKAGAHRYLLRIETSNEALYRQLHPEDHDPSVRLACLKWLRSEGYQVGTGVMMGLPGQTSADLADDIAFFKDNDIDMIGMGPYIVHSQTPMAATIKDFDPTRQLQLGLRMIALTRIVLQDVNIAATTALQALDPRGRELGLEAGANILMPNVTDVKYRDAYQLYNGKPCMDENALQCKDCLRARIESIDETIGLGQWGDSPHFFKRRREIGQIHE
ncbi:MAG: [FeFe] hydrogenase H-cluster radical SAM maturase HydE [Sedimentisphaerales bacterium]|nr:[FeFe] hydrogenase H-cluster radical SAM maturase HydE [Sedimentisphaerales bacterium]